jgi:2-oxoglutarate ferredoxin oxidoreductase subunit alpha
MEKLFMKGNEAVAEAAVRAGCKFFAGYPITPQNEIPEYMSRRLPETGGVFVQGESEVASINMLFGASSTGARVMTSSSGLGISLKTEGVSYMAAARLPAVIVNVSRGGPGIGSIQPAQQDYLQATKAMGSGGHRLMVFAPSTVQEAIDMTFKAFDRADRDRNPVMILMDGCVGAMMEPVVLPEFKTEFPDKSDWIATGAKGRKCRFISSFDAATTEALEIEAGNKRAAAIYKSWQKNDVEVEEYMAEDADIVIAGYGIIGRIGRTAVDQLRAEGIRAGLIRPKTLSPFPYESFKNSTAK